MISGNEVTLMTASGEREELVINTLRNNNSHYIVSFLGIDSIEKAQKYRNSLLLADKDLLPPLPPGEYFVDDVIGLKVITPGGDFIGTVEDVFETGSNDVYLVKKGGEEFLVPAIRDVVKKIDLEQKIIVIEIMKGLFD